MTDEELAAIVDEYRHSRSQPKSCGDNLMTKSTFLLPDGLSPACKSHPGVSS